MDFSPGFSLGNDFRFVSVFSASSADTCTVHHSLWWSMSLLAARAGPSLSLVEDSRDLTVAPFCMDTGVAHARRCATTSAVWSMTFAVHRQFGCLCDHAEM